MSFSPRLSFPPPPALHETSAHVKHENTLLLAPYTLLLAHITPQLPLLSPYSLHPLHNLLSILNSPLTTTQLTFSSPLHLPIFTLPPSSSFQHHQPIIRQSTNYTPNILASLLTHIPHTYTHSSCHLSSSASYPLALTPIIRRQTNYSIELHSTSSLHRSRPKRGTHSRLTQVPPECTYYALSSASCSIRAHRHPLERSLSPV